MINFPPNIPEEIKPKWEEAIPNVSRMLLAEYVGLLAADVGPDRLAEIAMKALRKAQKRKPGRGVMNALVIAIDNVPNSHPDKPEMNRILQTLGR